MQKFGGLWLPDGETHLQEWMKKNNKIVDGRQTYQYHKLEMALKHVQNFRAAVDVGAHVGLWSMHLGKRFKFLHAFEPVSEHRKCFVKNVHEEAKVSEDTVALYPYALGDEEKEVVISVNKTSSGDAYVVPAPIGSRINETVSMRRLDDFGLGEVDFIKLDCEGYELFALRGGEEMLTRCRPTVIVEQKPGRAPKYGLGQREAVTYLEGLGAKLLAEHSGDFVLGWR